MSWNKVQKERNGANPAPFLFISDDEDPRSRICFFSERFKKKESRWTTGAGIGIAASSASISIIASPFVVSLLSVYRRIVKSE